MSIVVASFRDVLLAKAKVSLQLEMKRFWKKQMPPCGMRRAQEANEPIVDLHSVF